MTCIHDNDIVMAEGAQCHCTFMTAISAIVGNFSPDFASLNYSMRRLRISNKNILVECAERSGYGPEWLMWAKCVKPCRRRSRFIRPDTLV